MVLGTLVRHPTWRPCCRDFAIKVANPIPTKVGDLGDLRDQFLTSKVAKCQPIKVGHLAPEASILRGCGEKLLNLQVAPRLPLEHHEVRRFPDLDSRHG